MFENAKINQLLTNTVMGLNRTYTNLDTDGVQGLSKDELKQMSNLTGFDLPFVQLLNENFNQMDVNQDGNIATTEYNELLNSFNSSGLTYNQLAMLSGQNSSSTTNSLLETIMNNFSKVDQNRDGRVSQAEMNSYLANKEIDDKKAEIDKLFENNLSIFYSGSDSSDENESEETNSI